MVEQRPGCNRPDSKDPPGSVAGEVDCAGMPSGERATAGFRDAGRIFSIDKRFAQHSVEPRPDRGVVW